MRHRYFRILLCVIFIFMLFGACEKRRSSGGMDGVGVNVEAVGGGLDEKSDEQYLKAGDEGKASSDVVSQKGVNSARPGNNWVYRGNSKGGFFLVSSSSVPQSIGGDMIRRIELSGSTIREFDYNAEIDGVQGAYILISDEIRSAVPSKLISSDGLFSGTICGFIPGPENLILALAGSVGFLIDPNSTDQAFRPLAAFMFKNSSRVCRGVYSSDLQKLYAIEVNATGSGGGRGGVYISEVVGGSPAKQATIYAPDSQYGINRNSQNNFQDILLYNDELYLLSGNGRFDAEWDTVIHRVPLNEYGEPLYAQASFTRGNNPNQRTSSCPLNPDHISGMMVLDQMNPPVLLTGGTMGVAAWEIKADSLTRVDMDSKRPGIQVMPTSENGEGAVSIAYNPAGNLGYVLPHCHSEKKQKIKNRPDAHRFRITQFSTKDPAKSIQSIDAGYVDFLNQLGSAKYLPSFSMKFRAFAVGTKHIGIIGSASRNVSGLSAGADITIIDLDKGGPIVFGKYDDNRRVHEGKYGFKLAKGEEGFENLEQTSHAIIWLP